MSKLRVGIIGTGKKKERGDRFGYAMAYQHANAFQALDTCEMVACADIVEENARAFAESYGIEAVYIDYNNSQICSDNDSPWSGRTMYYYLGNFSPDGGASGNYMIRAVCDTLVCAGVPDRPAPGFVVHASPNPFREETSISFALERQTQIAIAIYDIKGRRIRSVVDRVFEAGPHSVVWDGADSHGNAVCSGIYFYRVIAPASAHTGKVTLLR